MAHFNWIFLLRLTVLYLFTRVYKRNQWKWTENIILTLFSLYLKLNFMCYIFPRCLLFVHFYLSLSVLMPWIKLIIHLSSNSHSKMLRCLNSPKECVIVCVWMCVYFQIGRWEEEYAMVKVTRIFAMTQLFLLYHMYLCWVLLWFRLLVCFIIYSLK